MCLHKIVKINSRCQMVSKDTNRNILFGHLKYDNKTFSYYRYHTRNSRDTPIIGYKILSPNTNQSYFFNEPSGLKYNHMYESSTTFIESSTGVYYPSGFHILWSLKDVKAYYNCMLISAPMDVHLVQGFCPLVYGIDAGDTQVVVCEKINFLKRVGEVYFDYFQSRVIFEAHKDA